MDGTDHRQGTDRDTEKGARCSGSREGDGLIFEVENGGERASVAKKAMNFEDYAGAWREGEGMTWEEIEAEIRAFRGHEVDG